MADRSDNLKAVAVEWWRGDGTQPAFDEVFEILNHDRQRVPLLIEALASTAPSGALSYIGVEALRLVLDSGLSPSELFLILTGAYANYLESLDNLSGAPFSASQLAWLLDDGATNRWASPGQTSIDGDGLRFAPDQTPWQAELKRRYPKQSL